jgi:aryl-alcohol dehydrogenase-like predicted oxidoreductase
VSPGLPSPWQAAAQPGPATPPRTADAIPKRALGRTGERVSILGMGGHHLGDMHSVETAIRVIHEGVDSGITFFDNAWEYYNGRTENWLGRRLRGRRHKLFLMTKVCTHGRSGALAMKMLEQSLRRL